MMMMMIMMTIFKACITATECHFLTAEECSQTSCETYVCWGTYHYARNALKRKTQAIISQH